MDAIEPLGEQEVALLLLQLGLLLAVARGLGQLAVRVGLPSVVGELSAGVVLGPSLLGTLAPGVFESVFPADAAQVHLLDVVSHLGVIMLLILTGLETDIQLIAKKGRSAAAISLCGIIVPFAGGFALGQVLPSAFVAAPDQRLVFSLFLGTALGISAIPVIAKVLIEMGVVRRDIGQLTLAAGMIDDTIGWILLSVVAGLARSGTVDLPAVVQSVISVVLVVGLAFTVGRRAVSVAFREVDNRVGGEAAKLTLLLVLALLFGSLTHSLGIEAVLGAFLIGILAGQSRRLDHRTRLTFEGITIGVFAPIFFAASGLRVDLTALGEPEVLAVGLAVLGVAILGKFAGAALGARLSGLGRWEALSLGAGMNARGAIEIIVATIGLSLGILTPEMFTIILLVAITTSLMAPPLLRFTLERVPLGQEERERLDAEARRATSFVEQLNRVLVPTRGGWNSQLAARFIALMLTGRAAVEVTTMTVTPGTGPQSGGRRGQRVRTPSLVPRRAAADLQSRLEAELASLPVSDRRRLVSTGTGDLPDDILREAARGYDLLVLGATDEPRASDSESTLFGGLIDRVVRDAPSPVFVVSHRRHADETPVVELRRIVLPVSGAKHERHALEVAMSLASAADAVVEVVHVVMSVPDRRPDLTAWSIADQLLHQVAGEAHAAGAAVRTHVRTAGRTELGVVAAAVDLQADLIVMAASLKPLSERAFFGHGVDHILTAAECPVLIVS